MSSISPYRDETLGMAEQCARLEAEVRTLRRSIRELSAKNAVCPRCARRSGPPWRRSSRIASLLALGFTVLFTYGGWVVPRGQRSNWPVEEPGLENTLLAFSGFR